MPEFQPYLDAVLGSVRESDRWRDDRYTSTEAQLPLQVKIIKDEQIKRSNADQKKEEKNLGDSVFCKDFENFTFMNLFF
ncbi:MAG: hypothetical protein NT070_16665 [Cyanobacteria bacterium]|nr:hypothetical protein [Cyanobacteriota bacterium]